MLASCAWLTLLLSSFISIEANPPYHEYFDNPANKYHYKTSKFTDDGSDYLFEGAKPWKSTDVNARGTVNALVMWKFWYDDGTRHEWIRIHYHVNYERRKGKGKGLNYNIGDPNIYDHNAYWPENRKRQPVTWMPQKTDLLPSKPRKWMFNTKTFVTMRAKVINTGLIGVRSTFVLHDQKTEVALQWLKSLQPPKVNQL